MQGDGGVHLWPFFLQLFGVTKMDGLLTGQCKGSHVAGILSYRVEAGPGVLSNRRFWNRALGMEVDVWLETES